jgi:hypothetical protein
MIVVHSYFALIGLEMRISSDEMMEFNLEISDTNSIRKCIFDKLYPLSTLHRNNCTTS